MAALAAACADPVPATPTWVDDVEPILRGNCFGCHGARPAHQDAARWDFYDKGDPRLADVGDFSAHLISGRDPAHFVAIRAFVAPTMEEGRRMPPPPAPRLSERDLAVLDGWRAAGFPRGARPYNRPPGAAWWPAPPRLLVRDDDQEQVLGKLTCAGGQLLLPRSGGFDLPAGLHPPCSAVLFDGQDLVSVSLAP